MERVEISTTKALSPGDLIEMHFKTIGLAWLKAAQIALIEWNLQGREGFEILSWQIPNPNAVIFKVKIKKTNPAVITAAVIGAAIIGAGVVAWLILDKVYQIVETPAGKIGFAGFGLATAAAVVAAVLSLLPARK